MAMPSTAAMITVGHPSTAKFPAQASRNTPSTRNSDPGSAGRTTPATPMARASAPRMYRTVLKDAASAAPDSGRTAMMHPPSGLRPGRAGGRAGWGLAARAGQRTMGSSVARRPRRDHETIRLGGPGRGARGGAGAGAAGEEAGRTSQEVGAGRQEGRQEPGSGARRD